MSHLAMGVALAEVGLLVTLARLAKFVSLQHTNRHKISAKHSFVISLSLSSAPAVNILTHLAVNVFVAKAPARWGCCPFLCRQEATA